MSAASPSQPRTSGEPGGPHDDVAPSGPAEVSCAGPDLPADAPFDPARTVAQWDALTPAEMRRRGSLKWATHSGDVIGAWVAEMDLGTAPSVTRAVSRAVREGSLGYLPGAIARDAREAVARHQAEELGWPVEVSQVTLLPNVLSALSAVIEHHTAADSAVIVPTPAYMPFLSIPGRHGRQCLEVPALHGRDADGAPTWALDLEAIEAAMAGGGGLLVLCHPWNPVGRVLSPAELDAVAELSARYRVPVFADEIHASLVLDPQVRHTPYGSRPGADPDLTFTATAVSKGWNVPGLMCAQLIASGGARRAWAAHPLSSGLDHGASALGAAAASAALSGGLEWNRTARAYIRANAELVSRALAPIEGLELTVPTGTYLAWLDCSGLDLPEGVSPAQYFAREPGVAMNDGADFGAGFESFCRLNLATGRAIEEETVERMVRAVARLRRRRP